MALILCIETATPVCSVALVQGDQVVALRESNDQNTHSSVLTIFIKELFQESGLSPYDLNAVAVSKGPGSYTGLRIGVSTAKGVCYGADIPLIAINTLQSMALGMSAEMKASDKDMLLCPMIDARRMEVYSALFDAEGNEVRETRAEIITTGSFKNMLDQYRIVFFGDGAAKCSEMIMHPYAIFRYDFLPSATHLASLAAKRYADNEFENVAYAEPFYLKDFIAGIPGVKGLS
jgi:tRNA threonylcarbamoyladenosine biosynthesis protein TsaB